MYNAGSKALLFCNTAATANNLPAVSAPVFVANQGLGGSGSASSITITTLQDILVGDFFVIYNWNSNTRSITSVVDGFGNTYAPQVFYTGVAPASTTHRISFVWSNITTFIPAGTVITVNYNAACACTLVAQSFRGISAATPHDLTGTPVSGGPSINPTMASLGTPVQPIELIVAITFIASSNPTSVNLTMDSGFSNQYTNYRGTTGKLFVSSAVVTNGVAPSRVETVSTSSIYMMHSISFKGA